MSDWIDDTREVLGKLADAGSIAGSRYYNQEELPLKLQVLASQSGFWRFVAVLAAESRGYQELQPTWSIKQDCR